MEPNQNDSLVNEDGRSVMSPMSSVPYFAFTTPLNDADTQSISMIDSSLLIKQKQTSSRARSVPISPQRRRPRGSDAGKSIHKAAEAPLSSIVPPNSSPDGSSQPRREPRTSLGSTTRMTPAPPSKNELENWKSGDEDSPSDSGQYSPSNGLSKPPSGHSSKRTSTASSQVFETQRARKTVWPPRRDVADDDGGDSRHSSMSKFSLEENLLPPQNIDVESLEYNIVPVREELSVSDDRPPQALIDAFEKISTYTIYLHRMKRLPFLIRNLRKGFRKLCEESPTTIPTSQSLPFRPPGQTISLAYHYTPFANSTTYETYKTALESLSCPLCSLFGTFISWHALERHLKWDHYEIEASLNQDENRITQISIYLKGDELMLDTKSPSQDARHIVRPADGDSSVSHVYQAQAHAQVDAFDRPKATLDSEIDALIPQLAQSYLQVIPPVEDVVMAEVKKPPTPPSPPHAVSQIRPITPPPRRNPHGPAHPIVEQKDSVKNPISYRPTGPHLYDHLSSLSLEPYENQSWFVLDKEEEIFELMDVLDEDKVICALWGRWILLNRPKFITNYLTGVELFIDQYWRIIHHAAGWGALRAWLLVLVSRRFLTNIQMVEVLKRYNDLVGKATWYK